MLNVPRVLVALAAAALISSGTALAQMAAPTMPAMHPGQPTTANASKGNPGRKCGQTPKGCHKNQPKPNPNRKCGQTPQGCHKNQPNGNPAKPPA